MVQLRKRNHMRTFREYHFKAFLYQALQEIDFIYPTAIQERVIPAAIQGESLVVESATGSGKTHAFLLSILQRIDPTQQNVQAVILSPTRELAMQLYQVCLQLVKYATPEIHVAKAIGGVDRDIEIKKYEKNQPHIVIGTIGRITDLAIQMNVLKIHLAKMVVIDEADMIFEEKEMLEVDKIMGKIQGEPQFLVFSATIPKGLRHFLNKYLEKVKTIAIQERQLTTKNIEHYMLQCKAKNKETVLFELLHIIHPFLAIIFVNSKERVDELALQLAEKGIRVGKLHGAMEDRLRKQMIKRINALEFQYVVASDIAARGIDIQGVSHVINFDLPNDVEFYIHRTGRTARYNQTGYAYSLYAYQDDQYVRLLQEKGLQPQFVRIQNKELVPAKFYVKKEPGFAKTIENEIHSSTKMPKKVKPGYKKKRLEEIQKKIKKAKKEHINEIYRKKAQKERKGK